MAKVGRPTLFKPEYVDQVRKLTRLGAKHTEIAAFFEVSDATVNNWMNEHPEFLEALKDGKTTADAEVATRLYNRAMGYSHPAVKIMQFMGTPIEVEYTEHYPPDTTAAIFWLKNRRPDLWRDRQEITGPAGGPIQLETIDRPPTETRDEWITRRQRELDQARLLLGTPARPTDGSDLG